MKNKTVKNIFAATILAGALLSAQSCRKADTETKAADIKPGEASVTILPEKPKAGSLLRAVATGAEGLAFKWERGGETLPGGAETLATTGFKKGDTIRVSLGQGVHAETVLLNSAPVVKAVTLSPSVFSSGTDIKADIEGWDHDADNLDFDYQWAVNGETLYSETGPVLPGNSFRRGDVVTVRVSAYDGEEKSEPFEAKAGEAENSPPRFTSVPPVEFSGTFLYKPSVTDKDADPISISIAKGPDGMKVESGSIEWNAKGQKGTFEVTVLADDGNGGQALQSFELQVEQ